MKLKNLKSINLLKLFNLEKVENRIIYALVVILLIVANLFIANISFKYDASYGHAYTLSAGTKAILKKLDDIVTIKFFVSSDIPTRLQPVKTQVSDLLQEYKKENGKIKLQILDPKKDAAAAQEAQQAGIPQLQFSQLESDKYAVTASYFGILLSFGGKNEIIPQATDVSSLEYNVTAAIYKLTNKELAKIGVVGNVSPSDQSGNGISMLENVLNKQFTVSPVDIGGSVPQAIDSTYKTLLVFDANQKTFSEEEIAQIKTYLQNGGKAIVFVDGVWVNDDLTTQETKHNLNSLLSDFGMSLNKDLVLSASSEYVNFGSSSVSFVSPYPFWVKASNFAGISGYFGNISQLTFPWVSSLSLAKKNGINSQWLVQTSKNSWEQKDNFVLNPQNIIPPNQSDLKQLVIAAESKNTQNGDLIVVPSSRFVIDRFLSQSSDNVGFVLNALNNLASGGALSGIRQRSVNYYPLPQIAASQQDLFRYSVILLLPALFALYGVVRLVKRK